MKTTQALLLVASLIVLGGTWIYTARVLIPYQISDSAAHDRPRGNLSDLYPRWLGARELLVHGRDPYSPEVSREIQAGYYGRALDPNRASDPKDQQGFVYPLYVVFYLAPTIHAPFARVQYVFFWVLVALTALSVPIWLRGLGWSASAWVQLSIVCLTLGSLGVLQGLKLQQLSLFVVPLIACAVLMLIRGRQWSAGILLALATVKPQLVWLLFLVLVIWSSGEWRRRWQWLASFAVTMTLLTAASELLLPHWIPKFLHALVEYQKYTGNISVMEELIRKPWSWLLELMALAATLCTAWKTRRCTPTSQGFVQTLSAALAVTIFLLPAFSPYNQVLLLPAILLAVRQQELIWKQGRSLRALWIATAVLLIWPWLTATIMAALSYVIEPSRLEKYWPVPFWTSLAIPVAVGALMLFYTFRTPVPSAGGQRPA